MRWTVSASVVIFCLSSPALAYNSEEHKVIGDNGSSAARVCESPALTQIADRKSGCQVFGRLNGARSQKALLRTYADSPGSEPDLVTYDRQTSYKQWALDSNAQYKQAYTASHSRSGNSKKDIEYNSTLYIPQPGSAHDAQLASLKPLVVWVGDAQGTQGKYFTFGDLVALYGDFRKVVTCDESRHECLLTDLAVPESHRVHEYLRAFAHGMVPPLGDLGQATGDWEKNEDGRPLYDNLGWWGDEMMRLASVNDWHFSDRAVSWYAGMHRLALHHAMLAVKYDDPTYLWQAIHYEANGLHGITDLFAPGHVIVHRDRASTDYWKAKAPVGKPLFDWGNAVLELGRLDALQPMQPGAVRAPRSSHAPDSLGLAHVSIALKAKWEESGHTSFNKNGAEARTLAKTVIKNFGDSRLFGRLDPNAAGKHENGNALFEGASKAVEEGLQSLLLAYSKMKNSRDLAASYQSLEKDRRTYFAALLYIPTELRRACYGRRDYCYGPGTTEAHWRAATYRDGVGRFLGIDFTPNASRLPPIDGWRDVTAWWKSPMTLFDGWAQHALRSGDSGYQFDKEKTQMVCEEFGLPPQKFSLKP